LCEHCAMIDGKRKAWKVYEDDKVLAVLAEQPAAIGHILVMPKNHHQIIEQVPDFILSHLLVVANKLMSATFEAFGAQGTNMLIQNGIPAGQSWPHFMLHIIPRREGDGLSYQWQPKQMSQDDLSTVELQIGEFTKGIGDFEREKPKPIVLDEAKPLDDMESDENSLRVRHLTRLP
jgi:histidine triad (HIT) family protein